MHATTSTKKTESKLAALQTQIEELQATLGHGKDAKKIVSGHIKRLHQYNEAKDATQILIGRLASLRQSTIRKIHEEYGLTDDD